MNLNTLLSLTPQQGINLLPSIAVIFSLSWVVLQFLRPSRRKSNLTISLAVAVVVLLTPMFDGAFGVIGTNIYVGVILSVIFFAGGLFAERRIVTGSLYSNSEEHQLEKLEQEKTKLMSQLKTVTDAKKEKQIVSRLNYVNKQILLLKAKMNIPIN